MPIESFGNIDDLDPLNPLDDDPVSEGDDHLRGIKESLQGNVSGDDLETRLLVAGLVAAFVSGAGFIVQRDTIDLDNSLADAITILRLRNLDGGLTFEKFPGPDGSVFVRQVDADGSNPKNVGQFERDGAVSWRFDGNEVFRTRDIAGAGNAGVEVKDGNGVLLPVGYNVMPRFDVAASSVRTLTFTDAGARFRLQANTGFIQLGNMGDNAAVNCYVSSALGASIRVPVGTLLRFYEGAGGQQDFNGAVDVPFEAGAAFTIVQFGATVFEAWGGALA